MDRNNSLESLTKEEYTVITDAAWAYVNEVHDIDKQTALTRLESFTRSVITIAYNKGHDKGYGEGYITALREANKENP